VQTSYDLGGCTSAIEHYILSPRRMAQDADAKADLAPASIRSSHDDCVSNEGAQGLFVQVASDDRPIACKP